MASLLPLLLPLLLPVPLPLLLLLLVLLFCCWHSDLPVFFGCSAAASVGLSLLLSVPTQKPQVYRCPLLGVIMLHNVFFGEPGFVGVEGRFSDVAVA